MLRCLKQVASKDRFILLWELFKQKHYQEDGAVVWGLVRIIHKHDETFPLCYLAPDSENNFLPLMKRHSFSHKN